MPFSLFALLFTAIGAVAALLLPVGIVFFGLTAGLVGAGVYFADLRRDAGPRFLAPAHIGR